MSGLARKSPGTWIALALAAVVVGAVIVVAAGLWVRVGDTGISLAGWIALVLGVLLTLVLGIGLMALMFISNRRGFDEADRDRR